jgi:hypothetical protein
MTGLKPSACRNERFFPCQYIDGTTAAHAFPYAALLPAGTTALAIEVVVGLLNSRKMHDYFEHRSLVPEPSYHSIDGGSVGILRYRVPVRCQQDRRRHETACLH